MPRLTVHRDDALPVADASSAETVRQVAPAAALQPLMVDVNGLAVLLSRSPASLFRDDAAGRIPAALRIGGSKRWRYADVVAWVEMNCPSRAEFEARRNRR